ncbi:unnamed protein product [Cyclocybe aegerita]|uniref:Uncharacterized protein n=1 Tax=Cyclocybe aegerita TaxID=1973307 RepID=A0A8S0WXK2_CYCAE|nr:unnamed protein product [Cyclocybe aegerita]
MTMTATQTTAAKSNRHLAVPTKNNGNPFATRGIYRPNAQRLSISLMPLVAQRSLLFRVQADMSRCTTYEETTSPEEYRGLYTLTPTASAKLVSAVLTSARFSAIPSAASSGSVYSQESWKSPASSKLAPPIAAAFLPPVAIDPRRQAIVFSPSVQWSDHSESESERANLTQEQTHGDSDKDSISESSDSGCSEHGIKTPDSPGAPVQMVQVRVQIVGPEDSLIDPDEDVFARDPPKKAGVLTSANLELYLPPIDLERPPQPLALPAPTASIVEVVDRPAAAGTVNANSNTKKLQKKKVGLTADVQKRASSKPSKAFGKVISHLSLQPAKREVAAAVKAMQNRKTMNIVHLSPDYKLPELALAEPLNVSFLANVKSPPLAIMPAAPVGAEKGPRKNTSPSNRATTAPFPTVPRPKSHPPDAPKPEPAQQQPTGPSSIAFPQGQRSRPQRPSRPPHLTPFPLPLHISQSQHFPLPAFQHPHPATPRRAASPPPLSTPIAELTPGPPLTATAMRKGHRRYKSSPAVPDFMLEELAKQHGHGQGKKRWDVESMPPLPPMPALPAGASGNGAMGLKTTMVGQPPAIPPRSTARPNSKLIAESVIAPTGAPVTRARAMSTTNRATVHAPPAKVAPPFPLPR